MSVLKGQNADVYIAAGTGTGMTGEATTSLGGNVYQITDTAKRVISPTAALTVLDGVTTLAASAYEVVYGTGKIRLRAAPAGAITVTGEYLTTAQLGQGQSWSLTVGKNLVDTATFGDAWEEKTATLGRASGSIGRIYADDYFLTDVTPGTSFVLELYEQQSTGARYVCIAKLSDTNITSEAGGIMMENVNFTATGWVDYVAPV